MADTLRGRCLALLRKKRLEHGDCYHSADRLAEELQCDPVPITRPIAVLRREWLHSCGRLVWLRYAIGRWHGRVWGYDQNDDTLPFRVARWLRLSGY